MTKNIDNLNAKKIGSFDGLNLYEIYQDNTFLFLQLSEDEGGALNKAEEVFLEEDEICDTCFGTGEITTMERVYPNEPHLAPVGSAPCPDCQDY